MPENSLAVCTEMTNHAERPRQRPVLSDFEQEADKTTVCIEAVKGPHEARSRIERARAASPNSELFVYDPLTQIAGQQG